MLKKNPNRIFNVIRTHGETGSRRGRSLADQRGLASIEMIPVLVLFVMLLNYTLGFFGIIHSGILNSIAARNYALETFRARANLNYLRDAGELLPEAYYNKWGYRFHGIIFENSGASNQWVATRRPLRFTDHQQYRSPSGQESASQGDHNTLVRQIQGSRLVSDIFSGEQPDEGRSGMNPVWLQTLYGICVTARCSAP